VREEITSNVEFTPKETDIYKIHQSGDLANLDGLDDESLSKLPSLLALRDAVYSEAFRNYVSHITNCGPLSGKKTDMAINVYTPGCFLLCHDDVIGSRRVSYILYLTDPDTPWQAEWGGALRLFPVQEIKSKDGEVAKTPVPDPSKVIPPAWNQLSFFAVQPGESFHDVEEVYHAESEEQLKKNGGRVRMAISGWFHIPQKGEDGYIEGEEEKNAKNSSLMQLKGNPAQYDTPQSRAVKLEPLKAGESEFEESELEFLIKYISPTYLTPDTMEQISQHFNEHFSISLTDILSKKFAKRLKAYVSEEDKTKLSASSDDIEKTTPWRVAKPPHKHRYLYQHPNRPDELRTSQEESPITELLDILLPSRPFRHWLQVATGCTIESQEILARRFRPGQDYTLASGHEGKTQLELSIGITPTSGWGEDEEEDAGEGAQTESKSNRKSKKKTKGKATGEEPAEPDDIGGQEVYMAAADDAGEDAAIYKSATDDDSILFFQGASWNTLSIVLRDNGVLKFVKYVGKQARGDRWDVTGTYEVADDDEDEDDEESGAGGDAKEDDSEEEFQGFSDREESESD
jgi:prolyl 3-hydroxylase /prolyl 3,4-dihydroxylase